MSIPTLFDSNGKILYQSNSETKRRKDRIHLDSREEVEICMNCTAKKCNGNCRKIREYKKEHKETKKSATRSCTDCDYLSYFGDYSLRICKISGSPVEENESCHIPKELYDNFKEMKNPYEL